MGARILIVEDEQLVAADLAAKLSRIGHDVVGFAASGIEAIRLSEQQRPELVLMDIRLQGEMDGLEAANHVKAKTGAKIIFVTAFAQMSGCADLPPQLCLSKPFSTHQLQAAVAACLSQS